MFGCTRGRRSAVGALGLALLALAARAGAQPTPTATVVPPSEVREEEKAREHAADTVHELEDIVVTGTRTEYAVDEAPVPVQVIGREEIKAISAVNIAEALDRVPGIYVRQNEQFGLGANTVRMQGAEANQVAILRNGRRFRGGVNGVVDLRDIMVEDVERIEIIRGPASSLYGSDAMGGVINIITREGSREPHFSVTAAAGTQEAQLYQASHGWSIGPFGYFLSYQHNQIALAQLYGSISQQFADSDALQIRDDISGQFDYQPTDDHLLTLSADYNPIQEGPESHRTQSTVGGDWRWTLSEEWEPSLGATWYGFQRENNLGGFEEDVTYNDSVAEPRLVYTIASGFWDESHLLTVGDRFRFEDIDSKGFIGPDVTENAWLNSGYLQDEVLIGQSVSTVLGASIDAHSNYDVDFNPRLSVAWRPLDEYRLTGIVARGYRAPNLLELYSADFNTPPGGTGGYVILGNPDLQPETDLAFNVQFDFKPIRGVSGFLVGFRHNFDDLILIDQICPTREGPCPMPGPALVLQYQNVSRAITQGVELTVTTDLEDMAWWPLPSHALRVDLSYSYLYSQCDGGCPAGSDGNELPFRPPNRFLPALTYEYEPLVTAIQLWGEYSDRTFANIENTSVVGAHWLWSTKLTTRLDKLLWFIDQNDGLGPGLKFTTVFVEVQNLFDNKVNAPNLVAAGAVVGERTILAGVQFEL